MYSPEARLGAVLNQTRIPVIIRTGERGSRLRVKIPFADGNRQWLQNGKRNSPNWIKNEKIWEVPLSWFNDIVDRGLERFQKLYVVQPYREQEKCAPACMNAVGHECQCSCMGANHGTGNDGSWFEVSETFATRWADKYLACRLMKIRDLS